MTSPSSNALNNPSDNLTPSPRLPKQKVTAFARLLSFVPRGPPPVVFPPPSWDLDDEFLSNSAAGSRVALATSNEEEPVAMGPQEPATFAIKLRALIDSLPIPGTASSANIAPGTAETSDEGRGAPPIPSGMDEGLVKMLSSEDLMNGNHSASSTSPEGTTKQRQSVWNILSGLRTQIGITQSSPPSAVEEDVEEGFMMYVPLTPKADSQLQLATSETILEYVDDPVSPKPPSSKPTTDTGDSGILPRPGAKKAIEKHVWVPSTTQLSLLTAWWGYRLYLPPPVMAKLGAHSLKATARAAMITTALKWLLDKIPMMLVPPQFRPAVKLLKRLSPVIGYVGVFIAWSWDRIQSLDEGNGVVLTATWLLPVALLPMSWDAGDIYRPILPPKPEEQVPTHEPSSSSKPGDVNAADKNNPADKGKERKRSFFRW